MAWFPRFDRSKSAGTEKDNGVDSSKLRRSTQAISAFRDKLIKRVRSVNETTAAEVSEAARYLNDVVENAREYVNNSQRALGRLQGQGEDSLARLLGTQSAFLRSHAREMSQRAALHDERARQAAAAAKSIADLAASIERLAGEARLLAVNARIESSRLGAQSAGFEVLASEMQRLSDEVASTNERVGELAGRLGQDLPWIAQHAREFRNAMDAFSTTASMQLDDTERGVTELRSEVKGVALAGGAVMEDILRASRNALSHLQFQDVVAQELRQLDGAARQAQLEALSSLGADADVVNEVPAAEYTTVGEGIGQDVPSAPSGEVMLF
jgi:methyl-accepting chemotaxis protein